MEVINKILSKYKPNTQDEFEIIFNKMTTITQKQFINLLTHIKTNNIKYTKTDTLDIINQHKNTKYRIFINNLENINLVIEKYKNNTNNFIFKQLNKENYSKEKKINLITDDYEDYNFRVKISTEEVMTQDDLNNIDASKIFFRLKNRVSYMIDSNKDYYIQVDITSVKQSSKLINITNADKIYEVELEAKGKNINTQKMAEEFINIYTILNGSNALLSYTEEKQVIKNYNNLFNLEFSTSAYGNQVVALRLHHFLAVINNNYTITDKVDGDRYFLYITDNQTYLLSNNLKITKLSITTDETLNNTLIDGEYLIDKNMFLAFDILFYKNNNVMKLTLKERFNKLDEIINKLGFKIPFDDTLIKTNIIEEINKFHTKNILSYQKHIIDNSNNKSSFFMTRKYFIFTLGISNTEIYNYTVLLWNLTTQNTKLPYTLDGIIMTHTTQPYTRNKKDIKFDIFKWKPMNKLSIDFYIEFKKSSNGEILEIFNSNFGEKKYRICYLYVNGDNNIKTPFKYSPETYLFIDNKEVRDIENNILLDKSVVEFGYTPNNKFSWIPLRTRHDKTEFVKKNNAKFGNYELIANDLWDTIQENITLDEFVKLSNESSYYHNINDLNKRVSKEIIAKETVSYYAKRDKIMSNMDYFHSYLKTCLIDYCSPKNNKKMEVLDFGMGRGGDFDKFFHARVKLYVGIDPNEANLFTILDSAVSRYEHQKKTKPHYPLMEFIIGDVGVPLNFNAQYSSLGSVVNRTRDINIKYFGEKNNDKFKTFDIINCQFVIHYLFKDDLYLENLKNNIKKHLNKFGYFICTTFDGDSVYKLLEKQPKYDEYYVDENGNKILLFSLSRKFDNTKDLKQTGLPIDVYISSFMELNTTQTEYLVSKDNLIKHMNDINMYLVDTDMFENFYENSREFFKLANKDINKKTGTYLTTKPYLFYQDNEINKKSFNLSKLYRYYIFQKTE